MFEKKMITALLGLGTIIPLLAQADESTMMKRQSSNKKMVPQFDMGDPIEPGQPGHPGYVPAAYSYPAGIRAPNQDWDLYLVGAFLYWKPQIDNNFSGVVTNATTPIQVSTGFGTTAGTFDLDNQVLFNRKPGYKPAFKVGLGWNTGSWDNWTLYGEYTWFHTGQGKDDEDNDSDECFPTPTVALVPSCDCPDAVYASSAESKWKLDMDILDVSLIRPAYQGKRLILAPFFGLRALWIKQNMSDEYNAVNTVNVSLGEYEKSAQSKAWSLGPRIGVDGSWLLGAGFRVIGNASASLLYTRYTNVSYNSNIPNGATIGAAPLNPQVSWKYFKSYGTVRPNLEIDAGLGWGAYLGDMYHFDLSATYDFHTFFSQNMPATIENWAVHNVDAAPGNLNIHGLTVKARFDF